MSRSRTEDGRFEGGSEKSGRITYKRYAKTRMDDSAAFLPAAAAVFAVVLAFSCWFLWKMAFKGVSSAAGKPVPLSPESVASLGSSNKDGYFIQLAGNEHCPAELLKVNVSAVPKSMAESNAMVAIRSLDAPEGVFLSREFIHKRDEAILMRAPLKPGDYEIVGYDNGTTFNADTAVARVAFSVSESSSGAFFASLDKSSYRPSEPVKASISGAPRSMIDDNAIVGLYRRNALPGEYISYEYIRRPVEQVTFRAPLEPGEYEAMAFTNGHILSEETMAARIAFTVEGSALGAFRASPAKPNYAPGETMAVKFDGVPKYMLDDGAMLGICEAGSEHGKFLAFKYIAESGGTYDFDAPLAAGEYELRGYTNRNFLAESTVASLCRFSVVE